MKFIRELLSRWWKQIGTASVVALIPSFASWLAREWATDQLIDRLNDVVPRLWGLMARNPGQSLVFVTTTVVLVLAVETKISEKRALKKAPQPPTEEISPSQIAVGTSGGDIGGGILSSPEPSKVELWIEPEPEKSRWLWRLRNRELSSVGPCTLRLTSARSFDAGQHKYREESGFRCSMGTVREIEAGHFSSHNFFARLEHSVLELGDTIGNALRWPDGDDTEIQRWQLGFELTGLRNSAWKPGTRWTITAWLEWDPRTKHLAVKTYNGGLLSGPDTHT